MEETLISFATAKLAKENGFDEKCLYTYNINTKNYYFNCYGVQEDNEQYYVVGKDDIIKNDVPSKDYILAPSQALLQKWLRDIQKIDIVILVSHFTNEYWAFIPNYISGNFETKKFETYEEALEVGLQAALKSIK